MSPQERLYDMLHYFAFKRSIGNAWKAIQEKRETAEPDSFVYWYKRYEVSKPRGEPKRRLRLCSGKPRPKRFDKPKKQGSSRYLLVTIPYINGRTVYEFNMYANVVKQPGFICGNPTLVQNVYHRLNSVCVYELNCNNTPHFKKETVFVTLDDVPADLAKQAYNYMFKENLSL